MARKPISSRVFKQLYAESNNQCAFASCEEKLFKDGRHIGKMAHIEGYSKNGPRYNPNLGDNVNDYENLLLLCGKHHDEIDQKESHYTKEDLQQIKAAHIKRMETLLEEEARLRWLSKMPQFMAEHEVIGRADEIEKIKTTLAEKQIQAVVSVSGLGGIGKTTLVKAFLQQYQNQYSHIIWISKAGQNILHDFADNAYLIDALKLKEAFKNPALSYEQRLIAIKKALEEKAGSKKLLVLDNVENELDSKADLALLPQQNNWQLLVTSRHQSPCLPQPLQLDVLSKESAIDLFCLHYPKAKTDADLNDLLAHIDRHTLTTELLAKLMAKKAPFDGISCGDLLTKLKANALNDADIQKKLAAENYSSAEQSLLKHLMACFNADNLSPWELWWLKHFALLPAMPYTYTQMDKLLSVKQHVQANEIKEALEDLVRSGWIKTYEKEEAHYFECHRLLQEVLLHQNNTYLGGCSFFKDYIWTLRNLTAVDATKEHWLDKKEWLPFCERLYNLYKPKCQSLVFSRFLNEYAMFLKNAYGNYEKAAEVYEKGLAIDLKFEGEQGESVAVSRSNLANVYKDLGRYEEAAELLEKALKNDIVNFGEQHPKVAIRQSNLANVYRNLGRYDEAAELLEKALANDIVNFGEQHPSIAICQSNLANVYGNLGRYEEAAELLEKALESGIVNFGVQHPKVAIRQSNLANVYRNLGRYDEAVELLEKALASDITNFGEQHPNVAIHQSSLAIVYGDLGRYDEAVELLERALESDIVNFGLFHPSTATRLNNMFYAYRNLKRLAAAFSCITISMVIALKCWGAGHPNTKTVIGTFAWFKQNHPAVKVDIAFLIELLGASVAELEGILREL